MEYIYKLMGGIVIIAMGFASNPLHDIAFAILAVGFLLAGCAHMLADEIRNK